MGFEHDGYMLGVAYNLAVGSLDSSTQNGAVIVADGRTVGAANNFPRGVAQLSERFERPSKYTFTEHAERGAIYQSARQGVAVEGATMWALWAACADCARGIIDAGIARLVTHAFYRDYERQQGENRKDWSESISPALVMLQEAGVQVDYHVGRVMPDGGSLLFNGEAVSF